MKKSLTLVLAIAMVFTMFASVAFAADATTTASTDAQTKFDALKAAGIMTGTVVDGQVVAGLDLNMDRASFAEVLVNLYNLPKVATTSSFSDVPSDHWALQQIEAAKAAGFMLGNGDGTFNPDGKITLQELASALDEANALEPVANADVVGADDWAKGYVAAAINAKLLASASDYKAAATRADLVVGTYQTYQNVQAEQAPTATFSATGASQLTVTFNKAVDTTKATFAVKKGTLPINLSTTTPVAFSADNMTATLTTATKLTAGDYTVTVTNPDVSGTVTVDDEKVAKITFTSDKAPLSNLTDLNVVYAFVKVYNQYNEDITSTKASGLNVQTGFGTALSATKEGKIEIDAPTGVKFSIDQTISVSALDVDSTTFASAILKVASPAQAATISVSKLANPDDDTAVPQVGDSASDFNLYVSAKDQYGNDVSASDLQSQVIVTATNPSVADVARTAAPDNYPAFTTDADSNIVLPLSETGDGKFAYAGTSQIIVLSTTTGNKATFDVNVKDAVKVDTLSVSAPDVAVVGEKFDIPFQAVDQFGAAITDADALTDGMTSLQISGGTPTTGHDKAATVSFIPDYVNNTAKLEVDASYMADLENTSSQTLFFSAVTGSGKLVTLNISVKSAATPVVVSGVTDDTKKAIAKTATTTIDLDNINVLDQYNRAYTIADHVGTYNVKVESSNKNIVDVTGGTRTTDGNTVTAVVNASDADNAEFTLTGGSTKGNATITISLIDTTSTKTDKTIANSAYTFNVKVVDKDDIKDYSVDDIGTMFAPASDATHAYAKSVTVNGLLTDGTVVALNTDDSTYYTVTASTYGMQYGVADGLSAGKLAATQLVDGVTDGDVTVPVVVVGKTSTGTKIITKTVTVSTAASKATTVALSDANNTSKESDDVVSVSVTKLGDIGTTYTDLANAAVTVKDQYGVEITSSKFANVIASTFTTDGSSVSDIDYGDLDKGDTFNLTAITKTGLVINFKVVVTQ